MNEVFYTEPFSENYRDQVNLASAGGSISFDIQGNAAFRFPTAAAREEYRALKQRAEGGGNK
ncbi:MULTISPECIES: hypothetical protein [Bacillus]|uniref:hypothetical protein n=1 Tax=Bacillus TaxID=1386 RepID=UPI0006A57158|nr:MULTISPECIES: hypothetical protein [Bacillus]MBL3612151.1 hypothetical protein [Bacillus sp. RHFS18]SLC54102.1 Uncharacterised protein [Mycobacteroides abscessus subsp. massiliense]KAF1273110.1 hypothetical protein BUE72_20325 [Bacillus amyloliquefaciens]KAF6543803.1 hypothetical protein G9F51_19315 [Bacillus sp. EKM207B]KAF6543879.1 hypothetical protein G9F50_19245 [Bacillus sp. EKM206B]